MPSSLRITRNHYRPGAWKVIAGFFGGGILLLVGMQMYFRSRLPEVKAAYEAADAQGEAIFEKIGAPPGSKPEAAGEKRAGRGRNTWQCVPTYIVWEKSYEVPGNFETAIEWYRKNLQGDGWVSADTSPPSIVQRLFKRGPWVLTLGKHGEWPDHTRVQVELRWSFHLVGE